MTIKTTVFLLGVGVGAAAPLILKAMRPLAGYALAGGMLAYEAACDIIEKSEDVYSASVEKIRSET